MEKSKKSGLPLFISFSVDEEVLFENYNRTLRSPFPFNEDLATEYNLVVPTVEVLVGKNGAKFDSMGWTSMTCFMNCSLC